MTSNSKYSPLIEEALVELVQQGLQCLGPALENLLNELMLMEREQILQASPYERTDQRKGYANGFKNKMLQTRVGKLQLKVPQTRDIAFYPTCLEKGTRSERALIFLVLPTKKEAKVRLEKAVDEYTQKAPRFSGWLEENCEEGFTFYECPREHWEKIRTNNTSERVNQEIKRRAKVARLFPNPESCLRLATAVVGEIHEEWISGRKYLQV